MPKNKRPVIVVVMARAVNDLRQRFLRACVAGGLSFSLLFSLALAVSPQLHERFHPQAGDAGHECAVTLIAHGKIKHGTALPLVVVPQPASYFTVLQKLRPLWVEATFLGACIFEHAPPALS